MRAFAMVVGWLAFGCGPSRSATSPPAEPPATSPSAETLTTEEGIALCERLHQEALTCKTEFVELNIDLRSKYSPEFAKAMSDAAVRAKAVEEGTAETTSDAANSRERCTEFVKPAWGPPQPRADVATLEGCYAKASCNEKMACMRPVIEPRFAYRARNAAGPR